MKERKIKWKTNFNNTINKNVSYNSGDYDIITLEP